MNLKRLTDRQLEALKFKAWDRVPFGAGGDFCAAFPRQAKIIRAIVTEEYRRERERATTTA